MTRESTRADFTWRRRRNSTLGTVSLHFSSPHITLLQLSRKSLSPCNSCTQVEWSLCSAEGKCIGGLVGGLPASSCLMARVFEGHGGTQVCTASPRPAGTDRSKATRNLKPATHAWPPIASLLRSCASLSIETFGPSIFTRLGAQRIFLPDELCWLT